MESSVSARQVALLLEELRGARSGSEGWGSTFLEWRPTCACGRPDTVPCVILDPFCGSGTALYVAKELGRHAVGVELNPAYINLAARRLVQDVLPL
jgi:hypothetical protein